MYYHELVSENETENLTMFVTVPSFYVTLVRTDAANKLLKIITQVVYWFERAYLKVAYFGLRPRFCKRVRWIRLENRSWKRVLEE